jgi:SecD/SecF fusion protein
MNRNNKLRWVIVLFVTVWAVFELTPPTSRDLIQEFKDLSSSTDPGFDAIVAEARAMQATNSANEFGNLRAAVGTNDLRRYFAGINVQGEDDPNATILNRVQRSAAGKIRLGLDLQGGTEFLLALGTNRVDQLATGTNAIPVEARQRERSRQLTQAIEVLRKRVDRFGVAEPVILPVGTDRISVQLPGLSDVDRQNARTQIEKAAVLEFRLVHKDSEKLLQEGIVEPGYEILYETKKQDDGTKAKYPYLVERQSAGGLGGKNITRANAYAEPMTGKPEISFSMDSDGALAFEKVTRENVGRRLAIVLDGEVFSAPNINGVIPGGRGQITGSYTEKEADALANILQNPLETPVKIVAQREVSATLGTDSIISGVRSAVIGVIAVSLFMLVYYLRAGLIANVALLLNLVILLGVMCSIDTTLTLPGIAGIVLTIGMAVDANVLIYERIREELDAGKSIRGAINAGYDKVFGTIFDANVTTLISSILLILLGTGPVKGFGITLSIGVAVSMFTALVVTRLMFDFLADRGMLKTLKMLSIVKGGKIDFLKYAKPAFILSWSLIIVGVSYVTFEAVTGRHQLLGVDFAGGDNILMSIKQRPDKQGEAVREVVTGLNFGDPTVQYQSAANGGEFLRVLTVFEKGDEVVSALKAKFPASGIELIGVDRVGPVIGKEIAQTAVLSSILALFGILVYVAFRYDTAFAVGAVLAIIHDVLMTMAWFFLTERQLSAPMVAAILTIIGFSINDTIVIFDRIREDLKLGVPGTFKEVMNKALNQTLSRTIITSGTVFLATLSLYLFGGGVINDFAFTFLVGILTGTYSSIYIASALVLWWHKGKRPDKLTTNVTVSAPAAGSPAKA